VRCTWLAGDLLFVSGLPAADNWETVAHAGRKALAIESGSVTFTKPGERPSAVVLLRLPEHDRRNPPDSIVLKAADSEIKLDPVALAKHEISLEELISDVLAGGDLTSRAALRGLLDQLALSGLEREGRMMLAARLRDLREVLRDRHPELISGPQSSQAASVDLVMAVDERSFWIVGWMRDADETLARLTLVTPEGMCTDLPADAFRFPRPDVQEVYGDPPEQKQGFVTYLRLERPSLLESGWMAVVERTDGLAFELPAPDVVRDLHAARVRILDEFGKAWPDRERLRTEHALPALARLQERHASLVGIETVDQYGVPPETPRASIVIPLYGRTDLVEHQLAHFGQDPELARADLIYVLDSPELAPALDSVAVDLHALYQVPFRVVKLTRNAGYSAANNIGAAQARADLLLLLNSDVLPIDRGWLGRMAAFYDSTPDIGTLGPKLLFEDVSIQHAGMYFERELHTSLWGNLHYYKGFHRDFAPACVSRPVPAVTGACMMLGRGLYEELGGFRHGFVQGGYEDSDLCLRLAEWGLRNWYLAEVELYHLEAQSFPSPERQLATGFNTWLQTHLWDQTIERIMQEQKSAEPVSTGAPELPSRLSSVG
jgi:O-antigen biosynthesis protein